jgi:hypothetical protein
MTDELGTSLQVRAVPTSDIERAAEYIPELLDESSVYYALLCDTANGKAISQEPRWSPFRLAHHHATDGSPEEK